MSKLVNQKVVFSKYNFDEIRFKNYASLQGR